MKLLVLGFECLCSEQFNQGILPRLKARLNGKNEHYQGAARLWSRGWADMMSGCDANTHGGYYDFPLQNRTPDWSKSVNLELIGSHGNPVTSGPDFGITPVEAQAAGALDTVIEGRTGLPVEEQSHEEQSAAVECFP